MGTRRTDMEIARGEIRRGDEWRSKEPKDKGLILTVVSIQKVEKVYRRRLHLQPSTIITLQRQDSSLVTQVRLDQITKQFTKVRSGPPHQSSTVPLPK